MVFVTAARARRGRAAEDDEDRRRSGAARMDERAAQRLGARDVGTRPMVLAPPAAVRWVTFRVNATLQCSKKGA